MSTRTVPRADDAAAPAPVLIADPAVPILVADPAVPFPMAGDAVASVPAFVQLAPTVPACSRGRVVR